MSLVEIKSIMDPVHRESILKRISLLRKELQPLWGEMTSYQMVKHCRLFEAWILGIGNWDYSISRSGPEEAAEALVQVTGNDTPLQKFAPSSSFLLVNEKEGNFEGEKELWVSHLDNYATFKNEEFVHDYFGKMTVEQIGIFAFKHTDHHLRQFGI